MRDQRVQSFTSTEKKKGRKARGAKRKQLTRRASVEVERRREGKNLENAKTNEEVGKAARGGGKGPKVDMPGETWDRRSGYTELTPKSKYVFTFRTVEAKRSVKGWPLEGEGA